MSQEVAKREKGPAEERKIHLKVPKKEVFGWAMYDFANSTFATIVATAVFSAYFVGVVAGKEESGFATLLLTIAISVSSLIVVVTAPVIGSIADIFAIKKPLLICTTIGCVVFTALLSLAGQGEIPLALFFLILAHMFYGTGENLIAAFLPELGSRESMGRISAFGWTLGYVGALGILGLCLLYVAQADRLGQQASHYVPHIMVLTACTFAAASSVTFLLLKERARPQPNLARKNFALLGIRRLKETLKKARHYKDLFRFIGALFVFSCGTTIVTAMSAVYAQEVLDFKPKDTMTLVLVVNITAAIGAFAFGFIQDRIGSVRTLKITLSIWMIVCLLAASGSVPLFWLSANLAGISMGSTQSTSRALVGRFSPEGRSGEFFGLWGLTIKLATVLGPLSFGLVTFLTGGDYKLAILLTTVFFFVGFCLLWGVDEERGIRAAQ